jgi:hypothetical protein
MNKKIGRNFEVFTPCDFIAAITQHIADKSFQLVRYYGWYSGGSFFGLRARPVTRKSPCLTSGPTFVTLRPWKRTLSASDSGPTPRRAKSDFLSGDFLSVQKRFPISKSDFLSVSRYRPARRTGAGISAVANDVDEANGLLESAPLSACRRRARWPRKYRTTA